MVLLSNGWILLKILIIESQQIKYVVLLSFYYHNKLNMITIINLLNFVIIDWEIMPSFLLIVWLEHLTLILKKILIHQQ